MKKILHKKLIVPVIAIIIFTSTTAFKTDFFEIERELKININDLFKINNKWYNNY